MSVEKKIGNLIHYGSTKYEKNKVGKIVNDNRVKPKGGLWTSPVNSRFGWKDWNGYEQFAECNEDNSFILELIKGPKIFVIDCLDDLIEHARIKWFYNNLLDFELLSKTYDAIWLTEKGQHETHLWQGHSLYGWDCETVFIMNPECVRQIKGRFMSNIEQNPEECDATDAK